MGAKSILPAAQSFLSYIQQLNLNTQSSDLPVPSWLQAILNLFTNIAVFLSEVFSGFPDFDIRFLFIIQAVLIPLILDVIFLWFITPIGILIMDIIDLVVAFILSFSIYTLGFGESNLLYIIGILVPVLWIISRLIFFLRKSKDSVEPEKVLRDASSYYLDKVIFHKESTISFEKLESEVALIASVVKTEKTTPSNISHIIFGVVVIVFLIAGLFIGQIIPNNNYFSGNLWKVIGGVLFVASILLFIIFILRLFPKGLDLLHSFKKFCRRWGFRILMFALDVLYLPVLQTFVLLIFPKKSGIDAIYYLTKSDNSTFNFLITQPYNSTSCVDENCTEVCSASSVRLYADFSLRMYDDVFRPCFFPLAFCGYLFCHRNPNSLVCSYYKKSKTCL